MATLKETIKPWFETGDYPTQAQFWLWMDSIRWNDELLAIADVTGLQDILNTIATISGMKALYSQKVNLISDGNFVINANLVITGIVVDSAANFNLSIGTTAGGNDIVDAMPVVAGDPQLISLGIVAKAERTIYFSGIPGSTDFTLLKNFLNSTL